VKEDEGADVTEIQGLDAVVLIVKDLERQRRFYRDVLGLRLVSDYDDAAFFECGQQKLALFSRGHHSEGTKRLDGASKGISHLEFRASQADYKALRDRLTREGFHAYRDNFEDADGNLFHFNIMPD
jgi:catechol 2,3-dioxygenase-like lactoylglutathione lyase family enzyme